MENIVKYIMGVAAKSNVEKRQVGCVITVIYPGGKETIISEGFNFEPFAIEQNGMCAVHAEASALEKFGGILLPPNAELKAYVTHPPCPDCAKQLEAAGITEVEVIEQFMKFDGDKLRFDLIDGNFMVMFIGEVPYNLTLSYNTLKKQLYLFATNPTPPKDQLNYLYLAINDIVSSYASFAKVEEELAKVLTFGARKYKVNNWKKCTDTGRYLAAAHRHLNKLIAEEFVDADSGLDPLSHLLTDLMFLYVLGLKYEDI